MRRKTALERACHCGWMDLIWAACRIPNRQAEEFCATVQAVASICAIAPADSHRRGSKEWEGGSVTIIVATAQGTLFQYAVHNLQGPQAPSCALEQEYFLLRNAM